MTDQAVSRAYALAILDPASGRRLIDGTHWTAGVAGAAIIDLVRSGALRLAEESRHPGRSGRFVAIGDGPLPGPAWDEALSRADGETPKNAVARIGGASSWTDRAGTLWEDVMRGLSADGLVRREEHRTLGLVPSTRWPVVDAAARSSLLGRVRSTLADGTARDDIDGSVTTLLFATGALPKVLPGESKRWLQDQGRIVSRGDWASEAVRRAVTDVQAAAIAAITAASIAATSST
jgi:hypothetical protein